MFRIICWLFYTTIMGWVAIFKGIFTNSEWLGSDPLDLNNGHERATWIYHGLYMFFENVVFKKFWTCFCGDGAFL